MATAMYCLQCESVAVPVTRMKGSTVIEALLWVLMIVPELIYSLWERILMIVPGFIYSLWRQNTKESVCPRCGAPDMIPTDSPLAARAGAIPPTAAQVETLNASMPITDQEYVEHANADDG